MSDHVPVALGIFLRARFVTQRQHVLTLGETCETDKREGVFAACLSPL